MQLVVQAVVALHGQVELVQVEYRHQPLHQHKVRLVVLAQIQVSVLVAAVVAHQLLVATLA